MLRTTAFCSPHKGIIPVAPAKEPLCNTVDTHFKSTLPVLTVVESFIKPSLIVFLRAHI